MCTNKWLWTYPITHRCLTSLTTLSFSFMPYIHNVLYYSLQEALRHPRCASWTWMEDPTFDLGSLRIRNSNVSTCFRSERNIDPLPIAFPARLNLKGAYSNITLNIDIENQKYVRHILIFNLHSKKLNIAETTNRYSWYDEGHLSTITIIWHIFKNADILHEAIECNTIASTLLQSCISSPQIEHHRTFPFIILNLITHLDFDNIWRYVSTHLFRENFHLWPNRKDTVLLPRPFKPRRRTWNPIWNLLLSCLFFNTFYSLVTSKNNQILMAPTIWMKIQTL